MNLKNILSFLLITLSLSCATDLDDNPVSNTDINDFIYRGLRTYLFFNSIANRCLNITRIWI